MQPGEQRILNSIQRCLEEGSTMPSKAEIYERARKIREELAMTAPVSGPDDQEDPQSQIDWELNVIKRCWEFLAPLPIDCRCRVLEWLKQKSCVGGG